MQATAASNKVNEPACARRAESAFRVLFSLVFIIAGLGHLVRRQEFVGRLVHGPVGHFISRFAPADFLIVATGVVLLMAGLSLLAGYHVRTAALALIAVLIPITVSAHIGSTADPGPLLKNVAILGGLIHFAATGAAASHASRHDKSD